MGAETAALFTLAGSGVLGTLGSMYSTSRTNAANKEMAEQANAMNYKMFKEGQYFNQMERLDTQEYNSREAAIARQYNTSERQAVQEFAKDMWQMEADYNSPAQQADRMRAAGLNPGLINDSGNVGSVQSVAPASASPASSSPASSPSAPSAIMPEMQNVFESRMLMDAISTTVSALDKQQDIIGKQTDNETRSAMNIAQLDNMIADTGQKLASGKLSKAEYKKTMQEYRNAKVQKFILENQQKLGNIQVQHSADMTEKLLRELDDKHRQAELNHSKSKLEMELAKSANAREWKKTLADLEMITSNIQLNNSHGQLNRAQSWKLAQETARIIWDNKEFRQTAEHRKYTRDMLEKEIELQVRQAGADYWNPFKYVGQILGGAGSAIVTKALK